MSDRQKGLMWAIISAVLLIGGQLYNWLHCGWFWCK